MQAPEPMPSYEQLVRRSYRSLVGALRSCTDCGWELSRRTWAENARLAWTEALLFLLCAVGWTLARRVAARYFFRVSRIQIEAGKRGIFIGGGERMSGVRASLHSLVCVCGGGHCKGAKMTHSCNCPGNYLLHYLWNYFGEEKAAFPKIIFCGGRMKIRHCTMLREFFWGERKRIVN